MYAVVEDRNQQFRVTEGERVEIPLLADLDVGASVTFDKVCVVGGDAPKIGAPYVDGASVTATVVAKTRGPKLFIQKFRRRKNSKKRTGFRASYTEVRIDSITG